MSIELELQQAIYSVLKHGLAYPVFDDVPENLTPPFVVIGDDTLIQFDTDGESGFEATLTIHTWSAYRGRAEVKEMQGAVYNLLHRADLTITGYNVLGCDFEFSQSMVDSDGVTRHGIQRFRIYIRG